MKFNELINILDSYKVTNPNVIYFINQSEAGGTLNFRALRITLTIFFTYEFVKVYLECDVVTNDFLVKVVGSNIIDDFIFPLNDTGDFKVFMEYLIHTYYSEKELTNEPLTS